MRLNGAAFEEFFLEHFGGNYHKAAKQLGADVGQLHRIINKGQGAGLVFIGRLLRWCAQNGVDYTPFIFLPEVLTKVNEKARQRGETVQKAPQKEGGR